MCLDFKSDIVPFYSKLPIGLCNAIVNTTSQHSKTFLLAPKEKMLCFQCIGSPCQVALSPDHKQIEDQVNELFTPKFFGLAKS
jgi:hypothetical protein